MSACFYNAEGGMVGVDPHLYVTTGEVPVAAAHVTAKHFDSEPSTYWKRLQDVRSDGAAMIQRGFDQYLVPHVPIPTAPPGAGELAAYALIIATSSTKAHMSVASVTAHGSPLATCLYGAAGLNANCAMVIALPTGVVWNPNSVETSPTIGDYIGAYYNYLFSAILSTLVGKHIDALGKLVAGPLGKVVEVALKHLLRRRKDLIGLIPTETPFKDPADVLSDVIRKVVDGLAKRL